MKSLAAITAASGILLVAAGSAANLGTARPEPARSSIVKPLVSFAHATTPIASEIPAEALTAVVRRLCGA